MVIRFPWSSTFKTNLPGGVNLKMKVQHPIIQAYYKGTVPKSARSLYILLFKLGVSK